MRMKAFPKPPQLTGPEVKPKKKNTHLLIINEDVRRAFFG